MYTQNLLQKKGINSYFSGCLTLTLRNKKKDFKKEGVLIIGALDRLKPKIDIKNLFNELIKYPYKFFKYNRSKKRLDDFILNKGFSKVTYKSQIIDLYKNVDKQRNLLANEQLNLIAKSKLVITSRLHVALPAIAYGTKVIFLKDGLEHINHQSRLKGISDYFYCCKSEDLNTLSLVDVKPKKNHRKIKKKLIESIDQFFKNK
jgi:Polysaccharide pyruvyl transferase.